MEAGRTHDREMTRTRATPRLQLGLRELIALVACCGTLLWAGLTCWQSQPLNAWTRSLRYGDPEQRKTAAWELGHAHPSAIEASLAPLVAALRDPDVEVRATAARSL